MAQDALPKTGLHNVAAEAAPAPLADHDPYPNTGVGGRRTAIKPHQMVDAASLIRATDGPLGCALLANETGTGKTATYALTILTTTLKIDSI
ncbi:hypothetical protein SEUCBS140593_010385 [Sporothrix eucalyptigena]|uniref:DEAD/DEAH box helicase domain-containing protein n=1 Tax=Sporothrix eucalyptigena TaxID=1812306 RepID=A0ABP0D161_9PEZI